MHFYSDRLLSLFHLNIRSLQENLDGLSNLLSNLNTEFSVIAVTETEIRAGM